MIHIKAVKVATCHYENDSKATLSFCLNIFNTKALAIK